MTDSTGTPQPVDAPDSTCILSAFLETDGSISLLLRFPGSTRPTAASIDPIETTVQAAGPTRRPVELRYGHPDDRLLRLIVAMHVDALTHELCQASRSAGVPRTELPLVPWLCATSAMIS